MKNKGQFLIEVVLGLFLLAGILSILASFLGVLQRASRYPSFNQAIAISGFEKYRNVLISLSKTNWSLIESLASNTNYYVYASGNNWLIATGTEKITSGNEIYYFSFKIGNYTTNTIKFVTTTAQYLNLVIEDYFLLPKLNVVF